MKTLNKKLTLHEFNQFIKTAKFSPNNPNKLVIHHTWKPTKASWRGERTLNGIKNHYEKKGWNAGPHLFVAEDGIWLFTPMSHRGIHAGTLNLNSIGIEVVGDYDHEVWSGETYKNAVGVIKALMDVLNLDLNDIYFHRDVSSKTCPGKKITREWLFNQLAMTNQQKAPEWAKKHLESLSEKGIMKKENPNNPVTRAEMATVVDRTLTYLIEGISKIV